MKQLSYLVGVLVAAVSLLPFCFLFLRSFWDGGVTLQPYYDVFLSTSRYLDSFWRSLGLTCTVAVGQLAVSVPAGFCFAKRSFPGKRILAFLLVALLVLPVQVTLVPNYLMLKNLGLLNTYAALILPALFAPLGTFLLGQSFRSIPMPCWTPPGWTAAAPSVFCGGLSCPCAKGPWPAWPSWLSWMPGIWWSSPWPTCAAFRNTPSRWAWPMPRPRGGGTDGVLSAGSAAAVVPVRFLQPGSSGWHCPRGGEVM